MSMNKAAPENVHSLPNADTSKVWAETVRRLMPDLLDEAAVLAELRMGNFKAHKAAGFTDDQALRLCIDFKKGF